jgi:hypothetical protein
MTKKSINLFENLIYRVELNDDLDGYVVINRDTGIYEKHCDYLPDAILAAIEGQARLKWYEEIAAQQAEEDDDDMLEIEVELDDRVLN